MKTNQLLIFIIIFSLVSCSSIPQPEIPVELRYSEPSLVRENTATIRGSQIANKYALSKQTVYVLGVDNKVVMDEADGWNKDLRINSGLRMLTIAFDFGTDYSQVQIALNANPHKRYEIKFRSDIGELFKQNLFIDIWIVDIETGKPVTNVTRGRIESAPGGYGSTPIFIPIN